MQKFVARLGAVNLARIVDIETKPAMRESMIGAVSAYQKAANFMAKVQFIENGGLTLLENWMYEDEKWYGEKMQKRKIITKLLQICYDLTLNDDSIVKNGYVVRDFFANSIRLMTKLLGIISKADLSMS